MESRDARKRENMQQLMDTEGLENEVKGSTKNANQSLNINSLDRGFFLTKTD